MPADPELVAQFLTAFPGSPDTQSRRVRAIREAHEEANEPFYLSGPPPKTSFKAGEPYADIHRSLAQVPKWRHSSNFDVAMRGRRDGFLLVLVGIVRLSREGCRTLSSADIVLSPDIKIKGVHIPRSEAALECPACAVTRWLRVLGEAIITATSRATEIVSPVDVDPHEHDCAVKVEDRWSLAKTFLPSINQYGHLSYDALSLKTITTIVAIRQTLNEDTDPPTTLPDIPAQTLDPELDARALSDRPAELEAKVDEQLNLLDGGIERLYEGFNLLRSSVSIIDPKAG